eukprot:2185219-Rhodomonas_salina.1
MCRCLALSRAVSCCLEVGRWAAEIKRDGRQIRLGLYGSQVYFLRPLRYLLRPFRYPLRPLHDLLRPSYALPAISYALPAISYTRPMSSPLYTPTAYVVCTAPRSISDYALSAISYALSAISYARTGLRRMELRACYAVSGTELRPTFVLQREAARAYDKAALEFQ